MEWLWGSSIRRVVFMVSWHVWSLSTIISAQVVAESRQKFMQNETWEFSRADEATRE